MGTVYRLPGDHKGRPYASAAGRAMRSPDAMLALFASCDDVPGFTVELITLDVLKRTIGKLFCVESGDHIGTDVAAEIAEMEKMLRQGGDCAFADGWIALRTLPGAISLLMNKVNDAVEDKRAAEIGKEAAILQGHAAEARYCHLAGALRRALGDKGCEAIKQMIEEPHVPAPVFPAPSAFCGND